jgi:ribosomal-protein-alanine N-acetyltransferase
LLKSLPKKGVYTLIIHLPVNLRLKVGRLGEHRFPKGYYAYTGSAMGTGASSLRKRVARHLQKRKHRFWHIDYLLAHRDTTVTAIITMQTGKKIECKLNRLLKNEIPAKIPALGFGASDCKENCGSHLLYLGEKIANTKLLQLYKKILDTKQLSLTQQKSQIYPVSNLLLSEPPLSIIIKNASLKDLERLYEIEKECFAHEAFSKKQIAYFLKASNAVNLVAKVDGEIAGFIAGLIEQYGASMVGHIYTIDVAPKYRRMGVGLKLLEEMEKDFAKRGAEACFLEVRINNLAARQLYQKRGYIELEKLNNYYARGIHGIRLKKELKRQEKPTVSFTSQV